MSSSTRTARCSPRSGPPSDVRRTDLALPAPDAARSLLNKVLVSTIGGAVVVGRITEVEAYDESDPASHTYPGPTPRNQAMFGPPGHLYVYLSYGMHHCANVVVGIEGHGSAVLLRAIEVVDGHEVVRARRGDHSRRELTNGPGKLCQALGIMIDHYGIDLLDDSSPVRLADDGVDPPTDPIVGPRIGITKAVDTPWRFRTS